MVRKDNHPAVATTVRTYHYDHRHQLQMHLSAFFNAYNFAKRLIALHGLTPYPFISSCFQNQPERFRLNPLHLSLGLNI
jgi:hypothetical protein